MMTQSWRQMGVTVTSLDRCDGCSDRLRLGVAAAVSSPQWARDWSSLQVTRRSCETSSDDVVETFGRKRSTQSTRLQLQQYGARAAICEDSLSGTVNCSSAASSRHDGSWSTSTDHAPLLLTFDLPWTPVSNQYTCTTEKRRVRFLRATTHSAKRVLAIVEALVHLSVTLFDFVKTGQ